MRRIAITIAATAAAAVLLALGAVALLTLIVAIPPVRSRIGAAATTALQRQVSFSSLSVRPFPPAIRVHDLVVAQGAAPEDPSLLIVPGAEVRLRLRPLLRGHVVVRDVVLHEPQVTIVEDAEDAVRSAQPETGAAPPRAAPSPSGFAGAAALIGTRVRIERGVVRYRRRDADGTAVQYLADSVDATLVGGTTVALAANATLQPGNIALALANGSIGPIDLARPQAAPVRASVTVTSADVSGLMTALVGPEPAIGGSVGARFTIGGTLDHLTATGTVAASNLTLARTDPQCPAPQRRTLTFPSLEMNVAWDGARFGARPLRARLGTGSIAMDVAVIPGDVTRVDLTDIAAQGLPLQPLLAGFLCAGYAVTGPVDLSGALSFDAADVGGTLAGGGRLQISAGKVVGPRALDVLGVAMRVSGAVAALLSADLPRALFSSPLDFDSLTASYQISGGTVSTRDLQYVSSATRIAAAGSYAIPGGIIDADMVIDNGRGETYARVSGSAGSPSVRVVPSTILRKVEPGKIAQGIEDLFSHIP